MHRLSRAVVSSSFREEIRRALPALDGRDAYWRMMEYLLFGTFFSGSTGRLVISQAVVARIEGEDAYLKFESSHYVAEAFLNEFRDVVLPDFDYTASHGGEGLAREVRNTGLPLALLSRVHRELLRIASGQIPTEEKVYFRDGRKFNAQTERRERESLRRVAAQLAMNAEHAEPKYILDYLNNLSPHVFTKLRKNLPEAYEMALKLNKPTRKKTQASRAANLRVLGAIQAQVMPFYQPTRHLNTVRVYALNDSLLLLDKHIRRQLSKGWVEYDLRAAQLAVVACLWDLPEVNDILRTLMEQNRSVWQDLFLHYNIAPDEDTKVVFKRALYSLIFGKRIPHIQADLTRHFNRCGLPLKGSHFFQYPAIRAVAEARPHVKQQIESQGYAITVFGKRIDLEEDDQGNLNTDSILAQQAQAMELKLIYPAFELASEHSKRFTIVLFQHDGFSVNYKDAKMQPQMETKLMEVVASEAQRQGVVTRLELS